MVNCEETAEIEITVHLCVQRLIRTEEKRGQAYTGNIGDIPVAMLYDFCNAFPTHLHEWMRLALDVLKIPECILKVIECLNDSAHSCFLLDVMMVPYV